jgi:glycine dehydrogenase
MSSNTLHAVSSIADFASRHIGPSPAEVADMLKAINAKSLDVLMQETVPNDIRPEHPLSKYIGAALSEVDAIAAMKAMAGQNQVFTSLIGQGYYGTHLPFVIQRNILENPAWYTAYTPYQPEISQGRLEALLNYQTMIAELTGLDVSNASLLDEGTAAAEAMAVAKRVGKSTSNVFFIDSQCHAQTIAVMQTRAEPLGWTLKIGNPETDLVATEVFGAIFQYPGTDGHVRDHRAAIAALKTAGAIAIMAADPLALVILTPPGELGADIAIGSTQRFGVPMGFGGPHAAYMAVRDAHKRAIPGRLIGVSVDSSGKPAMRLSLQTREQHIRREKATSNICTAQVLLAVIASMYAVYHGPEGLRAIASQVHQHTRVLAAGLKQLGYTLDSEQFFDTLTIQVAGKRDAIIKAATAKKINLRLVDQTHVGISLDETSSESLVESLFEIFGSKLPYSSINVGNVVPTHLLRQGACLKHPIFQTHHSETELLRYMRKLCDRDLALDRAMIPLGSCTMKLNATAEMMPVTWPEFGSLHPFAPAEQTKGYSQMFAQLQQWLVDITGYDAVSLQPNSGAQGEYAGLLAIRGYHMARGEGHRKVCLIPSSAHGTNPASAQMVGMEVVVVNCDAEGNVDLADLTAKAELHSKDLAALMVTYPSTHGVFEEHIRAICKVTHDHGGQVYMDGANMNAQVGVSRPGDFGADVSHLNLHKTFCIPHGGGGPGMGPIGVKKHLAPFLPGHVHLDGGKAPQDANGVYVGAVSAAPFGSASILPISYAYILMMGGEGLTRATQVAILSANYIAVRLEPHFPLLYKNHNGRVAHECILDPRSFKDKYGVSVDDIAKRLIDFGFHAPTMSFPVVGTLMVEPTESEAKIELDRFCDAMIQIRHEINDVANGRFSIEQSPLRHAPHTVFDLAKDNWDRAYSRAEGCFPKGAVAQDKYWCPVGRVDNVYGDKNLVCSCPSPESYRDEAA